MGQSAADGSRSEAFARESDSRTAVRRGTLDDENGPGVGPGSEPASPRSAEEGGRDANRERARLETAPEKVECPLFLPIINDPDPPMYGADGDLRRGDLPAAIIEGINEFAEHMTEYAIMQALIALLGPLAARFAAYWIKRGWKLIKKDGRHVLQNPKTGRCKEIDACFAAGTPIRTPDGDKPIEELKAGDVILARAEDDPDGPVQARVVEAVFQRLASVMSLMIGGQTIRLTEEHPFYAFGRGWVPGFELRAGDRVLGAEGEWLVIGKVEPAGDPVVVYNTARGRGPHVLRRPGVLGVLSLGAQHLRVPAIRPRESAESQKAN